MRRRRNFQDTSRTSLVLQPRRGVFTSNISMIPQGLFMIIITDNDEPIAFDVTFDQSEAMEAARVALKHGYGYILRQDDCLLKEQRAVASRQTSISQEPVRELALTANPRQPIDFGYGPPNARMAKSQLMSIRRIANHLEDVLHGDDILPEWVNTKIATALDRLNTAYNYIQTKIEKMSNRTLRQNPQYLRNGDQMCVFAWVSAILLSPISLTDLLKEAKAAGFDPFLVEYIVGELLEDTEIVETKDGKLVDYDLADF